MKFMKKGVKNKSGISAIVATVLIILIVIAGIGILWGAILPLVRNNLDTQEFDVDLSIDTSQGYTVYDLENSIGCVQVRRGADEGSLSGVKVLFDVEGSSYSSVVPAPESNQRKTYCFNLTGYPSPRGASVAPVFSKGGSTEEGSVISEAEFKQGSVDPSSVELYEIGEEYEGDLVSVDCEEDSDCTDWENVGCDYIDGKIRQVRNCNCGDFEIEREVENDFCSLMAGAISYWNFSNDYEQRSIIDDLVGENNLSMIGDSSLIEDSEKGDVLYLDGDYDYLFTPVSSSLNLRGGDFSFVGVVKFGSLDRSYDSIYSYGSGGSWNTFYVSDSNTLHLRVGWRYSEGETIFEEDQWYFLVGVYNNSEGKIRLYVDGELDASRSSVSWGNSIANTKGIIGGHSSGNREFFNGYIDQFVIFDRALSQEDIGLLNINLNN